MEEEEAVILSGAASAAVLSGTASAHTNEGKREEGKDRDTKAGAVPSSSAAGGRQGPGPCPGSSRRGTRRSRFLRRHRRRRDEPSRLRRRLRRRRLRTRNPRRSRRRGRLPLESPRGPPNDGEGFRETRCPRSTRGVQARARRGVFGYPSSTYFAARDYFFPPAGFPAVVLRSSSASNLSLVIRSTSTARTFSNLDVILRLRWSYAA